MNKHTLISTALLALVWLSGCAPDPIGTTPIAVVEYNNMGRLDRDRYTDPVIAQVNLARVMDSELALEERMASLDLVDMIATKNPAALDLRLMHDLASQLRDGKTPPKLKGGILRFLLRQNYSDLAAYIIPTMDSLSEDPEMKKLILDYLSKNPDSQMLAGIVRAWWAEVGKPAVDTSYQKAVEQISGASWDEALLGGLNSKTFNAEGEAMGLLVKKLPDATLRKKILALHPQTDAIRALQQYVEVFDYLPQTPEELISAVVIYKARGPRSSEGDMLPDAARLAIDWTKNYKYAFAIRDFHLLSRLARDPLRNNLKRTQLVLDVGRALKTRRHSKHAPDGKAATQSDNYWFNLDTLTMADLWNLYLLNEMLLRPHEQSIFGWMATGDLNDKVSAWGGLVFYENGQAEASIYHPEKGSDLEYQPQPNLIKDGRDSLCRFACHFEKVNSPRVGPTAKELKDAKDSGYYGLVLTRVGANAFAAHYYSPAGLVISLGQFPLRITK